MGYSKEELLEDRVFYHFYQICRIPHPSGGEKALSDFILGWAQKLGLAAEQDAVNNVLIRKAASPGYEELPGVMLQAHLDMVCEKAEGSSHDFSRDPIDWVIDAELLSTGGKTTLGADDGIGVAFAMAVLEDDRKRHPKLEVLFTVSEESDFTGVSNFDTKKMQSSYLINLDHACDREILCGSCGGMQADFVMPVDSAPVPEGWESWKISISGLKGGHSGEDIHRGHGNANVLLGRVLLAVEQCCAYKIAGIAGGSFRLAIPREASAVICLPGTDAERVKAVLTEAEADIKREFAVAGGGLSIAFHKTEDAAFCTSPGPVLDAVLLIPDGIYQMNEQLVGLVDTSDNMGELYLNEKELHIVFEIRSARNSLRTFLYQKMERLAGMTGAAVSFCKSYPSWDFRPQSELRRIAGEVYRANYGAEPEFLTVHAGLEVGYFFEKKPSIDAIAIGPDCWNFHSPSEMVSIPSVRKCYQFLCSILAEIR